MKYTVIWTRTAEQELVNLWLDASQRAEITQAAHAIDRALANDPETKGESRRGGRRILVEPPMAALVRVVAPDRMVRVLHVWRISARA